jgi:hypothetical protein
MVTCPLGGILLVAVFLTLTGKNSALAALVQWREAGAPGSKPAPYSHSIVPDGLDRQEHGKVAEGFPSATAGNNAMNVRN